MYIIVRSLSFNRCQNARQTSQKGAREEIGIINIVYHLVMEGTYVEPLLALIFNPLSDR